MWLQCLQINLYHCQAATYNPEKEFAKIQTFIATVKEPLVVGRKIIGKIREAELHVHNQVSVTPRACIYYSKNLNSWKLSKYCPRDVVAVTVKKLIGHESVVLPVLHVQFACHMMRNHQQRKSEVDSF